MLSAGNSMETASTANTALEAEQVAAAQKDPAAFDTLYQTYAQRVHAYLLNRVGNRDDAEELTAQTFLAALEGIAGYRHRGYFAAWLFSIARNKANDSFRRMRPTGDLNQASELPGEDDPFGEVADREQIAALRRQINALPDAQAELLRLRYVAELSFAEIATLLGRTEDAVKKSVYRCLERLQQELKVQHG